MNKSDYIRRQRRMIRNGKWWIEYSPLNLLTAFMFSVSMWCIMSTLNSLVRDSMNVVTRAPFCHGKPAHFVGEHKSLLETTFTYQCEECGQVFQVKR